MSSQNKQCKLTKYRHARKSDLYLRSNPDFLTDDAVAATVKVCLRKFYEHKEAVIALAVALSGLSVDDIYNKCVAADDHTLFKSSLALPEAVGDNALFESSVSEAYISLPKCFFGMITLSNLADIREENVNCFLRDNLPRKFKEVNVNRLSKILKFKASDFGFTDLELEFMGLAEKPRMPLLHYVRLDLEEVNYKHQQYQKELLKNDEQYKEIMRVVDYKPAGFFGSNRILKITSVKQLFWELCMHMPKSIFSEKELRTAYNINTTFLVYILELSTLHRPNKSEFGTLDMFALDAKILFLRDKGGDSTRPALLSDFAVNAVRKYIAFLQFLAKQLRYINRSVHDQLEASLDCRRSLLGTWKGNMLQVYKPSSRTSRFSVVSNWARHYVANFLLNKGFHTSDIQIFMGQDPLPLSLQDKYSTNSRSSQHQMQLAIEEHLTNELCLPVSIFGLLKCQKKDKKHA